jgi:hypothetical protein
MSLVLQSSGGGSITIQEPATASNFTQTLPAATGEVMVSGNMPAFSAYGSAAQTVSNATFTKITLDIEEFDTNNNFASSRFTPTVAGYYQVNGQVNGAGTSSLSRTLITLYKNGTAYKYGTDGTISRATVSCVVYMNGSTDYLELYGLLVGTGTMSFAGNSIADDYFNGVLVRAA